MEPLNLRLLRPLPTRIVAHGGLWSVWLTTAGRTGNLVTALNTEHRNVVQCSVLAVSLRFFNLAWIEGYLI